MKWFLFIVPEVTSIAPELALKKKTRVLCGWWKMNRKTWAAVGWGILAAAHLLVQYSGFYKRWNGRAFQCQITTLELHSSGRKQRIYVPEMDSV